MKKLLSLLSVLTISSCAIPTTIAANHYQKLEKNNKKQKNVNVNDIIKTSEILIENTTTPQDYFYQLSNSIRSIENNNLAGRISTRVVGGFNCPDFLIAFNNNQYFSIPININLGEDNTRIELIFRSDNLYLQGFIGHTTINNNNQDRYTYYHFDSESGNTIPTLTNINNVNENISLRFTGNYASRNGLQANNDAPIRWENIRNAFVQLANYIENPNTVKSDILKAALVRVILATSESIRFRGIRNIIIDNYLNNRENNWEWFHARFLSNWENTANQARNHIEQFGILTGFQARFQIDPTADRSEDFLINLNDINMFHNSLMNNFNPCNNGRKLTKRDLNNNNEYCLNNEKIIYYNESTKENKIISFHSNTPSDPSYSSDYINVEIINLNLGKINPITFNKIYFLGNLGKKWPDDCWGTKTVWGNPNWNAFVYKDNQWSECEKNNNDTFKDKGTNINRYFWIRNYSFHDIINNQEITLSMPKEKIKEYTNIDLQNFEDQSGLKSIKIEQKFGLTWFWKNGNYFLQILTYQYAEEWHSNTYLDTYIKIGNGIKLYKE